MTSRHWTIHHLPNQLALSSSLTQRHLSTDFYIFICHVCTDFTFLQNRYPENTHPPSLVTPRSDCIEPPPKKPKNQVASGRKVRSEIANYELPVPTAVCTAQPRRSHRGSRGSTRFYLWTCVIWFLFFHLQKKLGSRITKLWSVTSVTVLSCIVHAFEASFMARAIQRWKRPRESGLKPSILHMLGGTETQTLWKKGHHVTNAAEKEICWRHKCQWPRGLEYLKKKF